MSRKESENQRKSMSFSDKSDDTAEKAGELQAAPKMILSLAPNQLVKTTLKISGMMCSMCEAHINDTIRKAFKVKKLLPPIERARR